MTQGLLGKIAEHGNGPSGTKKTGSAASSASGNGVQSPSSGDTVELTSSAKLLERLEKSFASQPGIDRSRVDAVKAAIASGDYEVDEQKIATELLYADLKLGT